MTKLKVYEPFRSVFYAPQFVTLYGGHFAAEGLDVEIRTPGGGVITTGALLDGTAQICLGGIMRSLDLADRGQPFLPHFAEVNSRNGFFLLSRRPRPGFAWADLSGRTQSPHVLVSILARGILTRLVTRIYFDDEAANDTDPILAMVPAERRPTLVARREADGRYRFDIRLQGENETVFFDI